MIKVLDFVDEVGGNGVRGKVAEESIVIEGVECRQPIQKKLYQGGAGSLGQVLRSAKYIQWL